MPGTHKKPAATPGATATESYRKHIFVGVGSDYPGATTDAFDQLHAAGWSDGRVIQHRSVPSDADWKDTDWKDTDWKDTDWKDTDFAKSHQQAVVVFAFGSKKKS